MGAKDMALVDAQRFKEGMRRLAGAVCIITLGEAGASRRRAGLTATAVCSVSAEPPRLMVCINRKVLAHELVAEGGALCVNLLAPAQLPEAKRFAGMVEGVVGEDRFAEGPWRQPEEGAPELTSAPAHFQCRIAEVIPASTHSMVLCDVVAVTVGKADALPLIYFDGHFMSAAEIEEIK